MTDRLKAVVVDSEAAREIVRILTGLMFHHDDVVTFADIPRVLELANEVIETYLTDPPYLEELLDEYINEDTIAFDDLMEQVGALLDNATKHIYYDITEVKHTLIGDECGMVMLMI